MKKIFCEELDLTAILEIMISPDHILCYLPWMMDNLKQILKTNLLFSIVLKICLVFSKIWKICLVYSSKVWEIYLFFFWNSGKYEIYFIKYLILSISCQIYAKRPFEVTNIRVSPVQSGHRPHPPKSCVFFNLQLLL